MTKKLKLATSDNRKLDRHDLGEAWMMCSDCGSKLFSFDGKKDLSRPCPKKMSDGSCGYE